jgi:hypothetical protein
MRIDEAAAEMVAARCIKTHDAYIDDIPEPTLRAGARMWRELLICAAAVVAVIIFIIERNGAPL